MPEDIKRMRYYTGLFLREEEFQLEQDYNVRMRRIHNARLHAKGIVWGLDVKVGTVADSVIVEQGMALDYYHEAGDAEYQGREMIVVQDTPVDLSQYAGDDEVWLWIRYDESPAGDDPDRGDQPFNTIESFQIEHSLTRPTDEDLNIILARIVVNPDDTIDENSIFYDDATTGFSIRVGSGFAGPRVETDQLTLRAPTTAAPWAYMTGNEFDPGGPDRAVGINVVSERTRFTGPVDVEGSVDVQNDLLVQQNADVAGDLSVQGALAGRVPLGGVLAVFNYGANVPAASADVTPDGFMLADGQALPPTTTLHAMATSNSLSTDRPDLTNDVFLMGASSSGATGGANSVTVTIPAHSHSSDSLEVTGGSTVSDSFTTGGPSGGLASHRHSLDREPSVFPYSSGAFPYQLNVAGVPIGNVSAQAAPNNNAMSTPTDVNHTHSISVAFDLSGLDVTGAIGVGQSGDMEMSANAHENRPNYVSAVYLIRVN